MDTEREQVILDAVQCLLDGRFNDVADGDCEVTRKLKLLATQTAASINGSLKHTVDLSVIANQGVSGVAEMIQEINSVDQNTQTIAAAIEEWAASVENISANAAGAAQEVSSVAASSNNGLAASTKAVNAMGAINSSVEESARRVDALSEASEEIGKIIKEIDDIAKQTNLLALNATIEAARAGEAGKGFAVVAGEVKNLANQTGVATENIRTRIGTLQNEMSGIVESMQEGSRLVADGREVIQSSTDEMSTVSSQLDSLNNRISEINSILAEQNAAAKDVSEGVSNIAMMSASNVVKVHLVIENLEKTETPIVNAINDLTPRAGRYGTIHAAKSDHMIWMRKLAQMLAGRAALKPDELADHHSCRLGKWYDNQSDPVLTSLPEWREIKEPHKQVHAHGIEAARQFENGKIEEAVESVRKANDASKEVMRLLHQMSDKLEVDA